VLERLGALLGDLRREIMENLSRPNGVVEKVIGRAFLSVSNEVGSLNKLVEKVCFRFFEAGIGRVMDQSSGQYSETVEKISLLEDVVFSLPQFLLQSIAIDFANINTLIEKINNKFSVGMLLMKSRLERD
jgi:hypothetical protein